MSSSYTLEGKIKVKNDTQQVTDSFKKREFVVTDDSGKYEQHVSFQLTQDKCDLLDAFQVGQEITVNFNLRGREWTSPKGEVKYFNSLDAWRIEAKASQAVDSTPLPEQPPVDLSADDEEFDDLPF